MTEEMKRKTIRSLSETCELLWSVSPLYSYVHAGRSKIGYEFELAGTRSPAQPFCLLPFSEIGSIQRMLHLIATWLLTDVRDCRIEFLPHNNRIYFSTRHRNRPDVLLSINLLLETSSQDDSRLDDTFSQIENRLSKINALCV